MSAYLAYLLKQSSNHDLNCLINTLNPIKTLDTKILDMDQGYFAVSFHRNAPIKGNKYFENENWKALFVGDLIKESISWERI